MGALAVGITDCEGHWGCDVPATVLATSAEAVPHFQAPQWCQVSLSHVLVRG